LGESASPVLALSLVPFATAWQGESGFATVPTAVYGIVLLMAGFAYYVMTLVVLRHQGHDSALGQALGRTWKEKISILAYGSAIGLAFVNPWFSNALYVMVAGMWLIPDRRIERKVAGTKSRNP
jgi:uncharacterized membrane protein